MSRELSANEPLDPDTGPGLRGLGLVALGGTAGTLARDVLETLITDAAGLPLDIFVINITGAFLLGALIEALALGRPDHGQQRDLRLLLGTGVLGGYTTYSLLATDVAALLIENRIWEGIGYGLVTVITGGLASWTGILTARARGPRS